MKSINDCIVEVRIDEASSEDLNLVKDHIFKVIGWNPKNIDWMRIFTLMGFMFQENDNNIKNILKMNLDDIIAICKKYDLKYSDM